jgi:hypothetical protein
MIKIDYNGVEYKLTPSNLRVAKKLLANKVVTTTDLRERQGS